MSETPRDPSGMDEPHDILAAEEFEIGTRDQRHPPDPSGIEEPHDVLAAEEFAMPTAETSEISRQTSGKTRSLVPLGLLLAAAAIGFLLLRRR